MSLPRSLPNQITIARLALAVVLFAVLQLVGWGQGVAPPNAPASGALRDLAVWTQNNERLLLNLGAAIFLVAAISDILDGQIARRWNLTTDFGRIADPFADKLIVSGAFLFLVPIAGSGVSAWMVVVIVARESLIDGLRGFAESRGVAFPASAWGKAKMVLQSTAVTSILLTLANWRDVAGCRHASAVLLASALVATILSGVVYVLHARKLIGRGAGGETIATASAPGADVPRAAALPVASQDSRVTARE